MEEFLSQNSIYVVLAIVLIIWIGIFGYVVKLDRKISQLERTINDQDKVA